MKTNKLNLWKKVKSRIAFAVELTSLGIPENKVKNTIALLHWIISAHKYQVNAGRVFLNEKKEEVFGISKEVFKKHLHDQYPLILTVLIKNNHLYHHDSYSPDFGQPKGYGPTPKLINELSNFQEEYLPHLMKSLEGKKLQENTMKNNLLLVKSKRFADKITRHELEGEANIDFSYNWEKTERILSLLTKSKAVINRGYLIKLIEDKIDIKRKRSEKTGRIYTPFNSISNIIRRQARVKNKPFATDIDLRSCHLSFLCDYLYSVQPSIWLKRELELWRETFSDENREPRFWLAAQAGIDMNKPFFDKRIKKFMNSWINGGKFNEFTTYMIGHWPFMYKVWNSLNKKTIGNEISRTLESQIFRADWVVDLQKQYNVVTLGTHDGFCIFGEKEDAKKFFSEYVRLARESVGWKLYFTQSSDTELNIEKELESIDIKIEEAKEKHFGPRPNKLKEDKDVYLKQLDENKVNAEYTLNG